MIYDSQHLPSELKSDIYAYILENLSGERKEGETDEQFIYKTRKKGFGPFKRRFWDIAPEQLEAIRGELEERFVFLFKKLNAVNTTGVVKEWVATPDTPFTVEKELDIL